MVATQESTNSRFCSVVEIKLSFSSRVATYRGQALMFCLFICLCVCFLFALGFFQRVCFLSFLRFSVVGVKQFKDSAANN